MKKKLVFLTMLLVLAAAFATAIFAQETGNTQSTPTMQAAETGGQSTAALKYIGAAVAVGLACIGAGVAVGQIGAAAMGAMSENPELSGKALVYAGLAEGICLWGFLVALLVLLG